MRHSLTPALVTCFPLLLVAAACAADEGYLAPPSRVDVVALEPEPARDLAAAGSCLTARTLPCAVRVGETYGTHRVTSAEDTEIAIEAILGHLSGSPADVRQLSRPSAAVVELDFGDEPRPARQLDWAYDDVVGDAASPAFLTVQVADGFALFPVFGQESGRVRVADRDILGARFWRSASSRCTAVPVHQVHGPLEVGRHARLARIEDGFVPCLHAEEGTAAECVFSHDSGTWIEDGEHVYALIGQAIGLDGTPGGDHVVAARVARDASVACALPLDTYDSTGTSSGTELATACMVEELLSPENASGELLQNWATLEVCTNSDPHPDAAKQTRKLSDTVACYIERGAALNDLNGTERDEWGVYYSSPERCHVAWVNGVESIAAKRPATRSYPAPGVVVHDSPIVWRPYSSNVQIAN